MTISIMQHGTISYRIVWFMMIAKYFNKIYIMAYWGIVKQTKQQTLDAKLTSILLITKT